VNAASGYINVTVMVKFQEFIFTSYDMQLQELKFKGIVSRDFVVCFLLSLDRSDISTHQERVLLLLKVHFRIEFLDFRVRP
jgi:hypothetical protein